jgi:hypothetical protein
MFGQPLAYRAVTAVSGHIQNSSKSAGCGISGKSGCDGCDMPMVNPTIVRIVTVGKVEAESWQNPPNLENQFLHRWMWYSMDCRFKTANF